MALTNAQYDAIMRIYSQRQIKDRRDQSRRLEEVAKAIPRIPEIDAEVASLSVQKAKFLLKKSADDLDLDGSLSLLKQEKETLLAMNGYPADYLDMHYTCPICRDTGYVNNRKCSCFNQLELSTLYSASHLSQDDEGETFGSFSLDWYSEERQKGQPSARSLAADALQISRDFVSGFDDRFENLLLTGPVGVGKSFLSHCIARSLLDTGHGVVYLSAYDLFNLLGRYEFSGRGGDPDDKARIREAHSALFDCDLLVIDDLGTEVTNTFTVAQLFLIMNDRFAARKPVVLSTNLTLNEIRNKYSERIASRIAGSYTILPMAGDDIRIRKHL